MKEQSEITTILLKARDILAKGWCQNTYCDGDSYCVAGAIHRAVGGRWRRSTPIYPGPKIEIDILEQVEYIVGYIAEWNDASGRTQAEVLEAMDQAIQSSMK